VSARSDLRRVAPWLLCLLALGLMSLGSWLRWVSPEQGAAVDVGWLEGVIAAVGFGGIPVVGALIASRLPGNPYGWLWCATGLVFGVADVARPLVRVAGWPPWLAWAFAGWAFVGLLGLLPFVFLLFPTGRLPTPRWRWLARASVTGAVLLMVAVPFVPDPEDPRGTTPWALRGAAGDDLGRIAEVGIVVLFGLVLAGMASVLLRFRRASPAERRQLTWFLYAAGVNAVIILLDAIGALPGGYAGEVLSAAGFALLPVAVGVAVFRYRLYEIDRIVSRTVSYGLLTGALVVMYLFLVALLRPLLEPVTGSSALAVAGSTLAVAAAFNPARRRLQAAVDRRFDRARYDAARAVDAFAARLRNQVDLDEIGTGLRDTVTATVAPSSVGLWLRRPGVPRKVQP
jgi:hypothetical protein